MTKYEVRCLMAHTDFVKEKLAEAQEEGWEICGPIRTEGKWVGEILFYIPMKRPVSFPKVGWWAWKKKKKGDKKYVK